MRDLMGKVKEMQDKMASLQQEVEMIECEGTSGGGLVNVRLNGKGVMLGLSVDPSLIKDDEAEILEDLIVAAHNDAKGKVGAAVQEKSKELAAGLPIPPGMKLPF